MAREGMTLQGAIEHYLKAQSKSPNTIKTMRTALKRLTGTLGADLDLAILGTDDLILFYEGLIESDLKYKSVRTYLALVTHFFKYLTLREWVSFNTQDLERAKEILEGLNGRPPTELPKLPKEESVQAIIALVEQDTRYGGTDRQTWAQIRNAALVHALRSTGARVSEVLGLKIGDLDMKVDEGSAIVRGKGDKQRLVFFDRKAAHWINEWMHEHPHGGEEAPVFIRLDRKIAGDFTLQLGGESVRWLLRDLCKRAGVPVIRPHGFRHRFGTALVVAAGIGAAAELMGHADTNTTRVYTHLAKEYMAGVHAAARL